MVLDLWKSERSVPNVPRLRRMEADLAAAKQDRTAPSTTFPLIDCDGKDESVSNGFLVEVRTETPPIPESHGVGLLLTQYAHPHIFSTCWTAITAREGRSTRRGK